MERILAMCILLCCAGLRAEAYDIEADGIYYNKVTATELAVASGDRQYMGAVTIPESVSAEGSSWQVTAIADAAFYGCSELYAVSLPRTVTQIGSEAFVRCPFLNRFDVADDNTAFTTLDGVLMDKQQQRLIAFPAGRYTTYAVPKGITEIGRWAFTHCTRLTEVRLPSTVTTIGDAAFYGCTAITTIDLPTNLQEIGVWAFAECSRLREVTLPSTVRTIGDGAFSFCQALKGIYVEAGNRDFASTDGVLMNKSRTTVVAYPGGRGGDYALPATTDSIATQAFYGSNALESVTLPAKLPSVGSNQFVFCDRLKAIQVDRNNNSLAAQDGVLFSKDHTQIVCFPNAKGGTYSVPDGVTRLTHGPFLGSSSLTGIDIPLSVRTIDDWTFLGCHGLTTVNLPYMLTKIGKQAFSDCTALKTIICNGQPVATEGFEAATLANATVYVPKGSKDDYLGTQGWAQFKHIEEYGLYAADQTLERAQQHRIPILITSTMPITSALATLSLPEGMAISTNSDNTYRVELSQSNQKTHTLSCIAANNGTYSLNITPRSAQALTLADTLAYITVAAPPSWPTGTYELSLKDIYFTYQTSDNHGEVKQSNDIAALSVKLFVGDVNQNGRLSVADAVETIRYANGIETGNFHFDEADVNHNGTVNYYDAEQTVSLIQQQPIGSPLVVSDFWQTTSRSSGSKISCNSVTVEEGTTFMLDVNLTTDRNDLTAYQLQMVLPAGFRLATNDDGEIDCQLPAQYQGDGRTVRARLTGTTDDGEDSRKVYTLVCTSTSLSPLANGLILSIPVHAKLYATLTTHHIQLRHTLFADSSAEEIYLPDASASVTLTQSMGISSLQADTPASSKASGIYDLGGRKLTPQPSGKGQLNKGVYIIEGRKVVVK